LLRYQFDSIFLIPYLCNSTYTGLCCISEPDEFNIVNLSDTSGYEYDEWQMWSRG